MDITSKTRIEDAKKALIEKLTAEYGFEGFLHYTDISNLFRIIDSGYLYARNYVDQRFELDGADETVISRTPDYVKKYVRFYYKGQTPTLFNNEGIRKDEGTPHMPIPVALLFDKEIIMHRDVFSLMVVGET